MKKQPMTKEKRRLTFRLARYYDSVGNTAEARLLDLALIADAKGEAGQ